jgi:GNAT superfamily N-acetyltransferase
MDMVASALGRDRIAIEEADPRDDAARYCLGEYYSELGRRFKQGFDVSLSRDPDAVDMVRPRGAFLLAMSDGLPIGCVGLKGSGGEMAEIKRLWICQTARGFGIARRLMHAVENLARELSVKTLRLDTNSALPEALKLYRTSGWVEIDRFNEDPYPDYFFEKHL